MKSRSRHGRVDARQLRAGELGCARPDHERLREHVEGPAPGEPAPEEIEVPGHAARRQRLPLEVEALVDHQQLEPLRLGDLRQPLQATVQHRRALPAHDEAVDASLLRPLDVLAHHVPLVAGVAAQQRVIGLGSVPGLGVEPDVVVGEQRIGRARRPRRGPGRRRSAPARAAGVTRTPRLRRRPTAAGPADEQQGQSDRGESEQHHRDVEPADHLEVHLLIARQGDGAEDETPSASTLIR